MYSKRKVETFYCPVDLYDQIDGDLSRIDEFSMQDKGYLVLEVEEQYGEILSEALLRANNPAEFIINLFAPERPADPFIDGLRETLWNYARPTIEENLDLHFGIVINARAYGE
jgi:hypothetical protein